SQLFGTDLETSSELEQGAIWVGDGSILWLPVPSLSHGVVWISCPMLLRRWARFYGKALDIPAENSTNLAASSPVYLKDAIFKAGDLQTCENWKKFIPDHPEAKGISTILILSDSHCATLIQMSLWRQVKVKLDEHKSVSGGFRYEEAIPPDTLMYFPWGITAQARNRSDNAHSEFHGLMQTQNVLQIGGQESLGRGFVQNWQP
ncbi:MAG: RAMP superfamily CRISPR-associated protein, partial [Cyanobacteria bacterium J06642_2]